MSVVELFCHVDDFCKEFELNYHCGGYERHSRRGLCARRGGQFVDDELICPYGRRNLARPRPARVRHPAAAPTLVAALCGGQDQSDRQGPAAMASQITRGLSPVFSLDPTCTRHPR